MRNEAAQQFPQNIATSKSIAPRFPVDAYVGEVQSSRHGRTFSPVPPHCGQIIRNVDSVFTCLYGSVNYFSTCLIFGTG